ncbi:hypothetical protein HBI22_195740 [Parastagonospora nodorum]|nr:hypothetical protein HBI28_172640 [Parastagonospora nodorum]KAH5621498.1 hypothetical protein HBI22_195740 [Parastagonospora nodorum]KAH6197783.1 hypothetical protein HBI53_167220 [Parastagonospora nodorum]
MDISRKLQEVIHNDDLESIQSTLTSVPQTQAQKELDTSLALALPARSLSTIQLILQLGAKLNRVSWIAAFTRGEIRFRPRQTPLLTYLLTHGGDPNYMPKRTPGGCPHPLLPAAEAARMSDAIALRILLSHGAKLLPELLFHTIGLRQNFNGTATMEVLIHAGADVNYIARRWSTLLCGAVSIGDKGKVTYLMSRGADPRHGVEGRHLSAVEYGRRMGRSELVGIIECGGGDGAP